MAAATNRSGLFSSISEKGRPFASISKNGCLFCSKVSFFPFKPPPFLAAVATADQSWIKQPIVSSAAGPRSPLTPCPPPSVRASYKKKASAECANHNKKDDPTDSNKFKALAHAAAAAGDLARIDEDIACFESWVLKFGRVYDSMEEKLYRFEAFKDHLKYIERANKENSSFTVGLNDFSDLTYEEIIKTYTVPPVTGPPMTIACRVYQLIAIKAAMKRQASTELADHKPNVEDDEFNKFKALARANASAEDLASIDKDIGCFEAWILRENIIYHSTEEKLRRFEVFRKRLKYMEKANRENIFCTVMPNLLSDVLEDEVRGWYPLERYLHEVGLLTDRRGLVFEK